MESRSVYRDNQIVYPDLYYIWTYRPIELWKNFYKQTESNLYKKHICGIGFYSRFHAKHIVSQYISRKALSHIHIIRGSKLIEKGVTLLPKFYLDRVFVEYPFTKYGDRKLRKWVYPPEFRYDKHRRRHFILYLVGSAEDKGPKAFNKKYKKYFNGYRESLPVGVYLRKKKKIFRNFVREYRKKYNLPEDGIEYDQELLHRYSKKKRALEKLEKAAKSNSLNT